MLTRGPGPTGQPSVGRAQAGWPTDKSPHRLWNSTFSTTAAVVILHITLWFFPKETWIDYLHDIQRHGRGLFFRNGIGIRIDSLWRTNFEASAHLHTTAPALFTLLLCVAALTKMGIKHYPFLTLVDFVREQYPRPSVINNSWFPGLPLAPGEYLITELEKQPMHWEFRLHIFP